MSRRVALVPIRALHGGKTRLAAIFDERERSSLVLALASRLLDAMLAAKVADEVVVLTSDASLARQVSVPGVQILTDVPPGLNAAVNAGRRWAVERGAEQLLIAFPDLPEVTVDDLRGIDRSRAAVTIVADRQHDGTNALLLRGEAAIAGFAFRYGPGSCLAHQASARALGEMARVVDVPGMALDLDTEDDWRALPLATRARLRKETRRVLVTRETEPVLLEHS